MTLRHEAGTGLPWMVGFSLPYLNDTAQAVEKVT
jgi:hypothetical protein